MATQNQLESAANVAKEIMAGRMFKGDYGPQSEDFSRNLLGVSQDLCNVAGIFGNDRQRRVFAASLHEMVSLRMQHPSRS
jgi:hypothetical protein